MSDVLLPIGVTLAVWWASTGLIFYLDSLPRRTHRYSVLGATALLPFALYGLATTRGDATVEGAYVAFACAIVVWAWQEIAFLMGGVTGPRQTPPPAGCSEARRFICAVQVLLYHEFALIVFGVAVFAIAWDAPNDTGAITYAILWAMRTSAKLNLFLGVRNNGASLLPPHLRYLGTYFARRPMNLLFPVAVTAATVTAALIWQHALTAATAHATVAAALTGTLLALAILEHWLLVIPLPVDALWSWSLRARTEAPRSAPP